MKKSSSKNLPKVVVVVGPTASGKSDLAVSLAKKFNGEVISADSRQVYRGLDIGTGKITKKEMKGVPHHLLDVANPKKAFSVADFKKQGAKAIVDILSRGKVPIVAGGTGFYIQALVDGVMLPEVPPNTKLRARLSKKTVDELYNILLELDYERAENIDPQNPHRLIRAIEVATALGKVPKVTSQNLYTLLFIGIATDTSTLRERIRSRLIKRMKQGMLKEAVILHSKGLSYKRMISLGLEYRYMALHLLGKLTKDEMLEELETKIGQYAKRQRTWFKRDKRIQWFKLSETRKIEKVVSKFLAQ